MSIFNSFLVGFSSLSHSVAFVLCVFSFRKTENFCVSTTERLRQRGKSETKSRANKNLRTYLLCMKKGIYSVDDKITKK